jgi:hypothetical protein
MPHMAQTSKDNGVKQQRGNRLENDKWQMENDN